MLRRFLAPLLACLTLATCSQPQAANPALWEVIGAHGEHGWLFGTIHTLPREADWRSSTVSRALDQADMLVLEIAGIDDDATMQTVFQGLAHSPGLPPLAERVDPALRPALEKLFKDNHVDPAQFTDVETWAAALMLAGLETKDSDPGNGIDRALVQAMPGLPRAELEGTQNQLSIFDHLAEADQRVMLNATLREDSNEANLDQLAAAWRKGDLETIARETRTGMMADPQIRKALYSDRNAAWTNQIEAMLRAGKRPFIAVGTAHLAGADGLPAILAARGWTVTRLQ
jgi:uncharacterized protein YbaP (TraB family)